jgi:hypothetical protein
VAASSTTAEQAQGGAPRYVVASNTWTWYPSRSDRSSVARTNRGIDIAPKSTALPAIDRLS